jgi:regulator of protease activity HflC (stomatin/prohibitin superfamily)
MTELYELYPTLSVAFLTFIILSVGFSTFIGLLEFFCFFTIVREQTAHVYTLFGNVDLVLDAPGLHFLWPRLTWKAFLTRWLGRVYVVDLRTDQAYLRSLAVNSEEGAPMGVGVWYEMSISDPVAYIFKNSNPKSSLSTSVSNSTVKCLSNLPLTKMLTDRHTMSRSVRLEVHDEANEWGFTIGSVYIRKVHFRDSEMIKQIESKVVNRLRQFTSAIKQDGSNQVNIITSSAEKEAAIEFAKAGAVRPRIVGQVLEEISHDKEICEALFDILETQKMIESSAPITLLPAQNLRSYLYSAQDSATS